ncbi:MAG: DUF47 family protein [Clostridiales bacterium]|jgi:predicted phosphate transport protein (TIGR00153 family)|nr:DUF47 family protein [Clostridiales bacterium]
MSKKMDSFYFNNFVESAAISCEAAEMLKSVLVNFDTKSLNDNKIKIHEIEHKGDDKRHEMTQALVRAFITPIERDDILKLSQYIDDVTDSIEDILIRIYINNVTQIREDSIEFADLLIQCCNTMKEMLEEFPNFKKSKKLGELIIEINRLEEIGDDMYVKCMRDLHTSTTDPLEIIAWREIYEFFEICCDTCENVADIVEGITIGNR